MDTLGGYIATIVVSLLTGYFAQFLQLRSKLLCWSPHNFFFNLKKEGVVLQTNSLTLQNVGRRPAEEVEIIHKERPDFFELHPSVEHQETTNPNGEHLIKIKSLGPKEWVVLQTLSYKTPPVLNNVRWKHGQAKWVQIQPQRVWPQWIYVGLNVLLLVGAGSIIYWLLRAAIYIAGQLGYAP
jgi:hypothetical protein